MLDELILMQDNKFLLKDSDSKLVVNKMGFKEKLKVQRQKLQTKIRSS